VASHRRSVRTVGAIALAATVLGCTTRRPNPTRRRRPRVTTTTIAPTTTKPRLGTLKIALLLPADGAAQPESIGVRNSVDLAIRHAQQDGRLGAWDVEVEEIPAGREADTAAADTAASDAANSLRLDGSVMGVIGPLDSASSRRFLQALGSSPLPVLSPAAIDPELTAFSSASPTELALPRFPNFFRLAPSRVIVADRVVRLARAEGAGSVVVVQSDTAESLAMADAFTASATAQGLRIADPITLPAGTGEATAAAGLVAATSVDVVLAATSPADAAMLGTALRSVSATQHVIAVGRFDSETCASVATRPDGDRCVEAASNIDNDLLRAFSEDYAAARFPVAAGPYGPAAYDAAQLLLDTVPLFEVGAPLPSLRSRVLAMVRGANRSGASGPLRFSASGDRLG
jgi:branched-chain amino acid transport system substrate-binding protein